MEDMEDLAMGIKPRKEKAVKLKAGTKATIKAMGIIIEGIESESIADYKKLPEADKRALRKEYDKLADACYTARNLIREACNNDDSKKNGTKPKK